LLVERCEFYTSGKIKKIKKIDEEINTVLLENHTKITTPVQAYITFTT
jgi:hypothetical protein